MTRIVVSRSGGFAGLTRTWSVEVSESEVERHWLPLLNEVEGASPPGNQRDRFVYHIAIVGFREATVAESALQDAWRELLEQAKDASEQPEPEGRRDEAE